MADEITENPRRVALTAVRAIPHSAGTKQVVVTVLESGEWCVEVQGVAPHLVNELPTVEDIKAEVDKVIDSKRKAAEAANAELKYYEGVLARFMAIYECEKAMETLGDEKISTQGSAFGPYR